MSRRRCFYIWDMSRRRYIWKISKNDQVCRIWAGYGKYGKIDEKVIFLQKTDVFKLFKWVPFCCIQAPIFCTSLHHWLNENSTKYQVHTLTQSEIMDWCFACKFFEKFPKIAKLQHKFWIWRWNFYQKSYDTEIFNKRFSIELYKNDISTINGWSTTKFLIYPPTPRRVIILHSKNQFFSLFSTKNASFMVYILSLILEEHFKSNFILYLRYEPALEPKNVVFGVFLL